MTMVKAAEIGAASRGGGISTPPQTRRLKAAYKTRWGKMYQGDCEDLLTRYPLTLHRGKVQLILTSPPFVLNRKKKYGNLSGDEYISWLTRLAPLLTSYLPPDGSIALELGNAWEPGSPTMSTLPLSRSYR